MSETIGSRIKKLRENHQWSLREVEKRTGINYSVLSRIESDKRPLTDKEVILFADLFDVTTDYLHGRTDIRYISTIRDSENNYLTSEDRKILEEIKKHPTLFHDLANAPEKKIKQLIKMWEFIKKDIEEEDDRDDIIDD